MAKLTVNSLEKRLYRLRLTFIIIWSALIIIVLTIPHIIHEGIIITETFILEEEVIESILIVCLLIVGFITLKIYQKILTQRQLEIDGIRQEQRTAEERLNDAFAYIGALNVQIQEIHSALLSIDKYPEHKNDLKKILAILSNKILGVVNVPWIMIRIILKENYHTLSEYMAIRENQTPINVLISNKSLIENNINDKFIYINSTSANISFSAFSIMPKIEISKNQQVLIQTILKQLEMLYLVLQSQEPKTST